MPSLKIRGRQGGHHPRAGHRRGGRRARGRRARHRHRGADESPSATSSGAAPARLVVLFVLFGALTLGSDEP